MKKAIYGIFAAAFLFAIAPASAEETTVRVADDGKVHVNTPRGENVTVTQAGTTQTVSTPVAATAPVVVEERVVVAETQRGDYDFEGQIVQVNQPESELVVRDLTPRDRRIKGDRGIVSTLKVGDYVKVDLRPGSEKEARRIVETRPV